jgi:UDPglucose 6-dehydrogenase
MRIGFIGLGRLGFPVAVALAYRGLEVIGYDIDPARRTWAAWPDYERGHDTVPVEQIIGEASARLTFAETFPEVLESDLVFLAVQTPHEHRFGGTKRIPVARADFDYTVLKAAVQSVVNAAGDRPVNLAIISTCLPGTIEREIMPLLEGTRIDLVYNPFFIAMGTTIADFLSPEFLLVGFRGRGSPAADALLQVYTSARINAPGAYMSITSAELAKVAYNTYISMKIGIANVLGEICDKTGADVDDVSMALEMAKRRVSGPAYLRAGMGDGGACHPRDNIAMSWLARELDLHHDPFDDAMVMREAHARYLAERMMAIDLPTKVILGYAYKPGCPLRDGSHALLVGEFLLAQGVDARMYDPVATSRHTDPGDATLPRGPAVYLVGCPHKEILEGVRPPFGSHVIDPFGTFPDVPGVTVERIGRQRA